MGCSALFCCFKDLSPCTLGVIGLVASIISFPLLIWGIASVFFSSDAAHGLYDVSMVLVVICFILFIILLILVNLRDKNRSISKAGKIISMITAILSIITCILLLVISIITLVHYGKYDGALSGGKWVGLILPSVISLICLIIMALVANVLYKTFSDDINSTPMTVSVAQNSTPGIINNPQPGIFPNDKGPMTPTNNVGFPVAEQTGTNL